jgi:hypothetical protein
MKNTNNACPLCRRAFAEGSEHPSLGVPRADSLSEAVREALLDTDAWAAGDALADDGEFLWLSDLTVYLAKLLARPLMKMYRAKLVRYREQFRKSKPHTKQQFVRSMIKQDAISDVAAAAERQMRKAAKAQAATKSPKDECVNGHRRTPENLRKNGTCIQCGRERSARIYAESKSAAKVSVGEPKVAEDSDASAS